MMNDPFDAFDELIQSNSAPLQYYQEDQHEMVRNEPTNPAIENISVDGSTTEQPQIKAVPLLEPPLPDSAWHQPSDTPLEDSDDDDDFGFEIMGGTSTNIARSITTANNSPWLTTEEAILITPDTSAANGNQETTEKKPKKKKSGKKKKNNEDTLKKRRPKKQTGKIAQSSLEGRRDK